MRTFASCLLLFALVQSARPCVNTSGSGTKYNGLPGSSGGRAAVAALRSALSQSTAITGEQMETELRRATQFEKRNDYAVALMYLGRSSEAVDLLQKLEAEKPGNYFVAANLGTAFELSGKNPEALRWIKEGIHRNPDSHEGTEWLHVKILEAKIAAQQDPKYFANHSVLELKPGDIGETIEIAGHKLTPKELMRAIQHQLTERLKFVEPPDAAVASLLFDYSSIEANVGTMEGAEGLLRLAKEYGYPASPIDSMMAHYERRIFWSNMVTYVVVGGGIIGFLIFCYKRGWFVLSSRDLRKKVSS